MILFALYMAVAIVSFYPFAQLGLMMAYTRKVSGTAVALRVLTLILMACLFWPLTWTIIVILYLTARSK